MLRRFVFPTIHSNWEEDQGTSSLFAFLLETSLLGFQSSLALLPLQLRRQEGGIRKNVHGNFQITNYFLPKYTRTVSSQRFGLISTLVASWINSQVDFREAPRRMRSWVSTDSALQSCNKAPFPSSPWEGILQTPSSGHPWGCSFPQDPRIKNTALYT